MDETEGLWKRRTVCNTQSADTWLTSARWVVALDLCSRLIEACLHSRDVMSNLRDMAIVKRMVRHAVLVNNSTEEKRLRKRFVNEQ